ncbi:putative tRNA pseudouridine synthase Pus10 [Paragonimus skrjabini miyazakii]|uniref:tRNA pseudouridine(55) synthase n=1 Tax=Paragonimus skrjabini miyazakii TaxID=59628 RepID=A0A8S9YUW6_9TREM|nr:putative tRNA pseudouridine synthase Pus10 [Paragonimus skrjabini miyazakii]
MTSEQLATRFLREWSCCTRCVTRLIHGRSNQCEEELVKAELAVYETPVCPACCGLLHHPSLCSIPSDFRTNRPDENLLVSVVERVESSGFKYLACLLKAIDPVIFSIREHCIWTKLFGLTQPNSGFSREANIAPTSDADALFCTKDVDVWRRNSVSAKHAWQLIVYPLLSTVLKVPFVHSPDECSAPKFLSDNASGLALFQPETCLLRIEVEFIHAKTDSECLAFAEQANNINSPMVRQHVFRLLNVPRKRNRLRRRIAVDSLESSDRSSTLYTCASVEPKVSGRFSKTFLQPLLLTLAERNYSFGFTFPEETEIFSLYKVQLTRECPVVLAGRYVKLSRRLPQTPWIVDGTRKLPLSVEELIVNPVRTQFGSSSRITFSSAGREDVDVRCLGLGRPFMLQVENFQASIAAVINTFSKFHGKRKQSLKDMEIADQSSVDLLHLATLINAQTEGKVFVRDLQFVQPSQASHTIKFGELDKSKCYRAVCWCPQGGLGSEQLCLLTNHCTGSSKSTQRTSDHLVWPPKITSDYVEFGPIPLIQPTPIRVLHRRAALERTRTVRSMRLMDYKTRMRCPPPEFVDYLSWSKLYPVEELFILELRCDAGTYVKEFIHGDLGRCRPSLASILQRQVDILALDVVAIELDWPLHLPNPDLPV